MYGRGFLPSPVIRNQIASVAYFLKPVLYSLSPLGSSGLLMAKFRGLRKTEICCVVGISMWAGYARLNFSLHGRGPLEVPEVIKCNGRNII